MFARFFRTNPVQQMHDQLSPFAPDTALWREVGAYLVQGRRPSTHAGRAALRAYLDLRESLGAEAAFRAGSKLTHEHLAEPCRRFFETYQTPAGMEPHLCRAWARFCLAADHLLAQASESASQGDQSGRAQTCFVQARTAYLEPIRAQAQAAASRQAGQAEAPAGALAAPLA